jgi:hypothetical protein
MNTVVLDSERGASTASTASTVSMVEVDAAAARAALAGHLPLTGVDLESPAVVAVLAAVVAAGWRPPAPGSPGDTRTVPDPGVAGAPTGALFDALGGGPGAPPLGWLG